MQIEERLLLTPTQEFRWIETTKSNTSFKIPSGAKPLKITSQRILFEDDVVVMEPAELFKGKKRNLVAGVSKHKGIKHIIVKTKYLDKFQQLLEHYSILTNQKISSTLLKRTTLFKNHIYIFKLTKCVLLKFPSKLDLELNELKLRLSSLFLKEQTNTIKVMVRGKIKEITR